MDKTLRTWRLTPSKDSDLWSQSTYRGEVWVRAHDAIEARKLCAQRFRVRPDRRRARMESPWYVRQLSDSFAALKAFAASFRGSKNLMSSLSALSSSP